jgi:septum site-determining protein MinC
MTDNLLKTQAFKLKGRLYTFTVLELYHTDISLFEKQLVEVITAAPKLFENSPIVLDCSLLPDTELNLDDLFQTLRCQGLFPVAIQGANPVVAVLAQSKGIAVLNGTRAHDKMLFENEASSEPASNSSASSGSNSNSIKNVNKLITSPVRSGQQVVSKPGDLIISASVSHGAELLAEGNIHVYGTLRGRALAGIAGDTNARIFCQALDAELISIAGFYRLSDAMKPLSQPCQIFLKDEQICIEPLN